MRKILLGTTGVVGAALIGMGAAQAQQAPTVRIGGFMATMYNWVDDNVDYAQGVPRGVSGAGRVARSKNDFRNEVEIHVFVNGKAANGLQYGAVVEIQNDNSGASGSGSVLDLDEAYVFLTSPTLGTLRFGEEDNAASIMQVRVPTITGFGPDGDFDDNVLSATNRTGTGPSLLTGINDGNDATKIVYLSPQFFGLDIGLSFAPSSSGEGERAWFGRPVDTLGSLTSVQNMQRDPTAARNEISAAIRYRGSFQNVGVAAGFGFMGANSATSDAAGFPASNRNITAYTAGLNLTAFGFTVGGEYTWGQLLGHLGGPRSAGEQPGRLQA